MEIRQLRYFVTMAEAGSLMKASERLHVAQPALSVHLANLEADFGVKLFDRSNRGIELTEDGRALYEKAMGLLQHHRDVVDSMRHRNDTPHGAVSLGIPSTCSAIFAPALYQAMRDRLPGVNLYIMDSSSAILYEWVVSGRLDFVVLLNVPENAGLETTPLFVEELCLASAPDPLCNHDEIEFEAIFDRSLVVPCPATTYRKILDDVALQKKKAFTPHIESDSFAVLRAIAMSGQADAVLPHHCMRDDIAAGRILARRLVNPEVNGVLSLAHVPLQPLDAAQRAVRELVVESLRAIGGPVERPQRSNVTPLVRALPSTVLPAHRKSRVAAMV